MPSKVDDCNLIIIDTSVLLSLYDFSYQTFLDILNILKLHKDKIWLPNHVLKEFQKNKRGDRNAYNNYSEMRKELRIKCENFQNDLKKSLSIYRRKRLPALQNLEDKFKTSIDSLLEEIKEYKKITLTEEKDLNSLLYVKEELSKFIEDLSQDNKIGKPYSIEELLEVYLQGEKRYKYKLPPGYMDDIKHNKNGKEAPDKFGDLLVWKQILDKVKDKTLKVLFISNDKKEDWVKNGILREELFLEFQKYSPNSSLNYLTLEGFIKEVDSLLSFKTEVELDPLEFITATYDSDDTFKNYLDECLDTFISKDLKTFLQNESSLKIEDFTHDNDAPMFFDVSFIDFENQIITLRADVDLVTGGQINNFGNFSCICNFYIEFMIKINDTDRGYSNIEINIVSFSATEIDYQGNDICTICETKEGIFKHGNGGYICEDCSPSLFCCSTCGRHFDYDDPKVMGNKCSDCLFEEDD